MITDLRSPAAVENVLDYVEGALGMSLDRASATYGWQGKTAGFDPTVQEWATAHVDLHWANLTGPTCEILDWEGWGAGPRGLDAATLWGYSLAVPALAERIETEFADDLATRSGKIAQLFTCAELLRMVVNFGDHPDLKEPLTLAAHHLADELRP